MLGIHKTGIHSMSDRLIMLLLAVRWLVIWIWNGMELYKHAIYSIPRLRDSISNVKTSSLGNHLCLDFFHLLLFNIETPAEKVNRYSYILLVLNNTWFV
jgi:hypothetical protein